MWESVADVLDNEGVRGTVKEGDLLPGVESGRSLGVWVSKVVEGLGLEVSSLTSAGTVERVRLLRRWRWRSLDGRHGACGILAVG